MNGHEAFQGLAKDVTASRLGALRVSHGVAAAAGAVRRLHEMAGPVIERAAATDLTGSGGLGDIEHFVLLMNENRSFDHYFGTMSGVAGFGDVSAAFAQRGYQPGTGPDPNGTVMPFRLDGGRGSTLHGDIVNDPAHSWAVQHASWNDAAMDAFVTTHLQADGPANGPAVMGYYTVEDIPIHRALADAFTICDHYFCSVIGPTDPNRLYWMSGTLDPDGWAGGPLLHTKNPLERLRFTWKTYPECLQEAGVGWKIYQDHSLDVISTIFMSGMMDRFAAYNSDTDTGRELVLRGVHPDFPGDFRRDVVNDTLPAVSWIIPSVFTCEHPSLPPSLGALGILEVLDILTGSPAVWEKTALIVSYDENGGFFDHVPPPTPEPGTAGEYVTAQPLDSIPDAGGINGPIGLGFRVPALIMSPYSRGGLVASQHYDHTSQLRLLERRFGVPIPGHDPNAHQPGLSSWRRDSVGDLTDAFDFGSPPADAPPPLPTPDPATVANAVRECIRILRATLDRGEPYPVPPNQMPVQDSTPPRRHPSGTPPVVDHQ